MLTNHILFALRQFRRHMFFSGINVGGLAIGMAACWVIALYVQHERSYDAYLPDNERICLVNLDVKFGETEGLTSNTPPPVAARLLADFPEIEAAARVFYPGERVVLKDRPGQAPEVFSEANALGVDSGFVSLFGFPMLEGDPATCLRRPESLVLTERAARKYFGETPAMGQTLTLGGQLHTVTGILRDLPANSSVQFDVLEPMAAFPVVSRFDWSWVWLQVDTWVKLRETPTPESLRQLESRFPAMVQTYATPAFERIGQNLTELIANGGRWNVRLRPLSQLHLGSAGLDTRISTLGDAAQVQIFSWVGVFILLLACINFMNISTARSMKRAKEVGVRKALGSARQTLTAQFMVESLLYTCAAALVAVPLTHLMLPLFTVFAGYELSFSGLLSPELWYLLPGLPLLAGLAGGLYPAFYLSSFNVSEVFRTAVPKGRGGHARLRSGLVVFQFSVSLVLIICTMVVYLQLRYTREKPLGIEREHVLLLNQAQRLGEGSAIESVRQQLLSFPEVLSVSVSADVPARSAFADFYEPEQGAQSGHPVAKDLMLTSYLTDEHFIPTLGVQIQEGRNFTDAGVSDGETVILNEAAAKAIGWEQPVGQWLRYPGGDNRRYQVVGVMRDFHTASLHSAIQPMALFHSASQAYSNPQSHLVLRLRAGSEKSLIPKIEALWRKASPAAPLDYSFLHAEFARLYRNEEQMGAVLGGFTLLSLLVGCLGLFALAVFTAEQRTKEIGIRKVLGASVVSVVGLLSKDFMKLVLISLLLASPFAAWAMNQWLQNFVYRIEISPWIFLLSGALAILIAFLTISTQSLRAAMANPVNSLKS
ncbi:MAG: FtsX-like permease family protein [Bacteroidetes bacterium]|nr:MAG: FtsX-like permease family protein [Bacteroidota bacterium]